MALNDIEWKRIEKTVGAFVEKLRPAPHIRPKHDFGFRLSGQSLVQLRRVARTFGSGSTLLVVEGIPMWSCPHCGESYFTAQTMHELERIKALRNSVAVERPVSVAAFHQAGA
jgi:YgiT-type zinc finger domain-containing protein